MSISALLSLHFQQIALLENGSVKCKNNEIKVLNESYCLEIALSVFDFSNMS